MKFDLETGQPLPARQPAESREVYFIQAVQIGLIKIGVADDAAKRLRGIALVCPDRLKVLGVKICRDRGTIEEKIHAFFQRERRHSEWFEPSERLQSYIIAEAWNPVRTKILQAIVDHPTLPRGRPARTLRDHALQNSRKTVGPEFR